MQCPENSVRGNTVWCVQSWRFHSCGTVSFCEHSWLHYSLYMSKAQPQYTMICLRRLHYSLQMWTLQSPMIWSKFSEPGHGSTSTLICPLVVHVVSNATSAGLISCTVWRGASLFLSARWPLLLLSPYSCSKFHKYWKHIFKDLDMDFLPSSCTTGDRAFPLA